MTYSAYKVFKDKMMLSIRGEPMKNYSSVLVKIKQLTEGKTEITQEELELYNQSILNIYGQK